MDRGDKSSSRGESFFGFFFFVGSQHSGSSEKRPDFGEIRPPLLLSLTGAWMLLLDASWLLSISMLPLIFLLDDMMPLVFLSLLVCYFLNLCVGTRPRHNDGTGRVLENLLCNRRLGRYYTNCTRFVSSRSTWFSSTSSWATGPTTTTNVMPGHRLYGSFSCKSSLRALVYCAKLSL